MVGYDTFKAKIWWRKISIYFNIKFRHQMSKVFYTVAQNLGTACTMECGKVVVIPGYPVGVDFGNGQISIKTAPHSFSELCEYSAL